MSGFFNVFSALGCLTLSLLFLTCFAMGLFTLCEYVEQKPNYLKKLVKKIIIAIAALHGCFILFDCISLWRFILSLLALALQFRLQQDLPKLPLVPVLVNIGVVFLNHFLWLTYFFKNHHSLLEVVSFYFFIVWAVPVSIAISYSTSELLPGFYEETSTRYQKARHY